MPDDPEPTLDLELPVDALQRHYAIVLSLEENTLRVHAHREDSYTDPDASRLVLHESPLDLWSISGR